MFCSENCCNEHQKLTEKNTQIFTYRTSAKHLSSLESFYQNLAEKEKFCILCGGDIKSKNKTTNKIVSAIFMFATLVPGSFVAITSKPFPPVIMSLVK